MFRKKVPQKLTSLVWGIFCILIPCANIFLISRPSGNWWIKKFAPEDEAGQRYLTSSFMVKSLQFFNGGGSTSQTRSRHFIEVWSELVDSTLVKANMRLWKILNPQITVFSTFCKLLKVFTSYLWMRHFWLISYVSSLKDNKELFPQNVATVYILLLKCFDNNYLILQSLPGFGDFVLMVYPMGH